MYLIYIFAKAVLIPTAFSCRHVGNQQLSCQFEPESKQRIRFGRITVFVKGAFLRLRKTLAINKWVTCLSSENCFHPVASLIH